MRIIFLTTFSVLFSPNSLSSAFVTHSAVGSRRIASTAVFSVAAEVEDVVVSVVDPDKSIAKEELMELTRDLKSQYGVLLVDSKAKESFRDAVEKLENLTDSPTDTSLLVGDWTLLCSYSSAFPKKTNIIDTSKIPFLNEGPIKDIKDTLNDSIEVVQRIKYGESSNSIDSIDHIINYAPPNVLSSFLKDLPDAIKDLDINPLKVSDTKVVLKHKAEVEAVIPVIKTKLSLQSVVINVAGKSQQLEPSGADVLGINIPFGEFLNAGSFETTVLDESIRVSRSKVGPVEQIRVFVKVDDQKVDASVVEEEEDVDDDELAVDDDDDDELADDTTVDAVIVVESDDEENNSAADDDDDSDGVKAPSDIEN